MKIREKVSNSLIHLVLTIMSILWLIPIIWVILTSLRIEKGSFVKNFLPESLTFDNYIKLFTDTFFPQWFSNTFFVACCSCVLTVIISLGVAYVISRMRFKMRKPFMNIALILGMFPGFMSMIAIYYVLKSMGLTQSLLALIIVYSSGAGLQFYIAKGFFDTIPKSIDEAAKLDGATNAQIFYKIILPLSKPILIYSALTAFTAPWMDFIFAKVIMGTKNENFTVAVGLFEMLDKEHIDVQFTQFAAGSVCIAIPITIIFILLQRFYVEGVTGGAVKS
ncbi:MAG: sugar ABC transporter permease [Oscillospiraceae bacterium]|jgi:arabinogalactan oligomer/maltooligosaccharide transport system permease protein|nr:sugar ABC transporter permease [Oscillospiraceae bacterium]